MQNIGKFQNVNTCPHPTVQIGKTVLVKYLWYLFRISDGFWTPFLMPQNGFKSLSHKSKTNWDKNGPKTVSQSNLQINFKLQHPPLGQFDTRGVGNLKCQAHPVFYLLLWRCLLRLRVHVIFLKKKKGSTRKSGSLISPFTKIGHQIWHLSGISYNFGWRGGDQGIWTYQFSQVPKPSWGWGMRDIAKPWIDHCLRGDYTTMCQTNLRVQCSLFSSKWLLEITLMGGGGGWVVHIVPNVCYYFCRSTNHTFLYRSSEWFLKKILQLSSCQTRKGRLLNDVLSCLKKGFKAFKF